MSKRQMTLLVTTICTLRLLKAAVPHVAVFGVLDVAATCLYESRIGHLVVTE